MSGCAGTRAPVAERDPDERIAYHRTVFPATPVLLLEDYSVPPRGIHQLFRWRRGYQEWQLTVLDPQSRHAGFLLKRPLVIPGQREKYALYLEVRPPEAAEWIGIGLRDQLATDPADVTALPIAPYRVKPRTGDVGGYFVIPLADLERAAPLNWHTIRGAQVTLLTEYTPPMRRVLIRHLQIAPKQILDYRFRD